MSSRTDAYAGYLREIYRQYDALVDEDHLSSEISLATIELQPEQIISFSESFDIEELIFLVLMQASKDAEQDLRDILDEIEAVSQTKRRLREISAKLKKRAEAEEQEAREEYRQHDDHKREFVRLDTDLVVQMMMVVGVRQSLQEAQALADDLLVTRQRLRTAETLEKSQEEKDALSELSELQALRMQLVLDRLSKLQQTLSNLLKKISETGEAIAQNLH